MKFFFLASERRSEAEAERYPTGPSKEKDPTRGLFLWNDSLNSLNPILVAQHQPFIEFYGRSIEDNEIVGAWIGVGEFGVTVETPNAHNA